MLSGKRTSIDELIDSEPMQNVKDAKVRRFSIRKVCSGDRAMAKNVAGHSLPSAEEIRH